MSEPVTHGSTAAALAELAAHLELRQPQAVLTSEVAHGELTVTIALAQLVPFLQFLREDDTCRFSSLVDITAIDWPQRPERFDLVWQLLSMYRNQRIRVRARVRDGELVPSATAVHRSADWFEREVFDLFGIAFSGHPDLRRILTDYGFKGHPLRKDFPTTGYVEVRYDEIAKRVVYEPVKLVQDYRLFDFMSPWEGAKYILPPEPAAKEGAK